MNSIVVKGGLLVKKKERKKNPFPFFAFISKFSLIYIKQVLNGLTCQSVKAKVLRKPTKDSIGLAYRLDQAFY